MEVHGLHHSFSCLLDGDLILLAHCGKAGAGGGNSQVRPPPPGLAVTQSPTILIPNPSCSQDGHGLHPARMAVAPRGTHLTG